MPTHTHILIGTSHPNDGGINPSHLLEIVDGSRQVWRLHTLAGGDNADEPIHGPIRWVPDPAHLIDDLRILVALFVTKNSDAIGFARDFSTGLFESHVDTETVLTAEQWSELRQLIWNLGQDDKTKLVVTIDRGPELPAWTSGLASWPGEVVVCTATYDRWLNPWDGKEHVEGSLPDARSLPDEGSLP